MPLKERFESKFIPEPFSGCWLWTGGSFNQRYGQMKSNGKRIPQLAHRIAWELYRGQIPEGLCVLHRCDTPLCVNPDHLFLGTHRDNNLDMRVKGRERPPYGEEHWNAKLTCGDVRQIRDAIGTHAVIAKQFGVSQPHVSRIKNYKRRTKEASA
jgi:hypothetical protein